MYDPCEGLLNFTKLKHVRTLISLQCFAHVYYKLAHEWYVVRLSNSYSFDFVASVLLIGSGQSNEIAPSGQGI